MYKRPIGVWFSVAVLIFLLSLFLGYEAGVGIARVRNQRQLWPTGSLNNGEKHQFDATLSALITLHSLPVPVGHDKENLKSTLQFEIDSLKNLKAQPGMQPVKPLIDLHLAMACIHMSAVEERENDQTKAIEYMESGKELLRSLGWQDCSEETLKAVAQKGIYAWELTAPRKEAQR